MGVLKFQSWLRYEFSDQYGRNFAKLSKGKSTERLFIDANALVHNAINSVYSTDDEQEYQNMFTMSAGYWNDVADTFLAEIVTVMQIVQPTKMLYIAFDGPVMKAKLVQQRQRSYKSSGDAQPFDRNQVKPGTDFMATICDRIRNGLKLWKAQQILEREKQQERERKKIETEKKTYFGPAEIFLSDTYDPGEGEHKIMTVLRSGEAEKYTLDVIYSPDSDMHILTYLHCNFRNVILMRPPHVADEIGPYEFFHATETKKLILTSKPGFGCIEDFIIVSCFGGNDFVPALPFAKFGEGNGFKAITTAYYNTFGNSTDKPMLYVNNKIDWYNLYRYLVQLQIQSEMFLYKAAMEEIEHPEKYFNSETGEDRRSKVLNWALTEKKGVYSFNQGFFNERYKRFIFGTYHEADMTREEFINFDSTKEQVRNYLEGLSWVMSYYQTQGNSVNNDWAYVFHYPPDTEDLVKFLKSNHHNPTWESMALNHANSQVNTPLEHLITILRKDQLWMLPTVVSTLFLEVMPELYPDEVSVDKTSIPFGVEGHDIVLVNYPSMASIRRLFDQVRDNPTVKRVNEVRRKPLQIWPGRGGKKK